ncbi:MAG TPA: heterodisulfide reductase-related iron-sulfur binding cluster [Bryobacteraceae bacterium]|nr:heterodisulfide reductase-related iron-sulfur binding cluster [Bryobacteraceae bacterium]
MAVSEQHTVLGRGPRQADLDKCVHCGLCLNSCPTYRENGLEMDSPRGRIYQMVQIATGQATINPSYIEHIDLCLACRGCESACPSGVPYGRMVEAARSEIESRIERPRHVRLLRKAVFEHLLPSKLALQAAGSFLYAYRITGLQKIVRSSGLLKRFGIAEAEALSPEAEVPDFFRYYGRVLPAIGQQRYRVAMIGGCMANVFFARLNEATVRVLQHNGCEVSIPAAQTCCGALHVHAGVREKAEQLARQNIDAILDGKYDAIITNAAGCGSTLKEYGELLEDDPAYAERGRQFSALMKDVTEFLGSIELKRPERELPYKVTYQDSCHLAHGQKIRSAPRLLLKSIPGLVLKEMPMADLCCGSAGIYNVVQIEMSMAVLERKMNYVNSVDPEVIATANPGCMLQLRAGAKKHGKGQPVKHVVELLDEAYRTS